MNRLIASLIAYLCLLNLSFGQTIKVCNTCEISTIVDAIKVAKDYDTIQIKKGNYKEYNIIVDKPLTIIGEKLSGY